MLKTIITLPDGTEISSGSDFVNVIKQVTLTECVNSGEELTLGSTCANALEASIFVPEGTPDIAAGEEVMVHKENAAGDRTQVGIFILEKPSRPNANTMKITGYDRVSRLDKDLTAWLSGLDGWPYTLTTFARMVCAACGLTFQTADIPNGDFPVYQFGRTSVTGRQIMQWLGEICCRFCRATAQGEIEFAWYTDSRKTISFRGERYYFQNGLTYEAFSTAVIEAVQIRLADSENGELWPGAEDGANSYIITGNPILSARISEGLETALETIKTELAGVSYTPCRVSLPACLDIRAGNTVTITDKKGKTIVAYVMTKTQSGQKDTLESFGSPRRNSVTAMNNPSRAAVANTAAQQAAADARKYTDEMNMALDQEEIFNRLTNNGTAQGIYRDESGNIYINADYIQSGKINGDIINGATLNITDGARIANFHISGGYLYNGIDIGSANSCGIGAGTALGGSDNWMFWAGNGAFRVTLAGELHTTNLVASGGWIAGWTIDEYGLWSDGKQGVGLFNEYPSTASIAGSPPKSDWRIVGGNQFGVDKDGNLYAVNANISGTITANDGKIGGWYISEDGALVSKKAGEGVTVAGTVRLRPTVLSYMVSETIEDLIPWSSVVNSARAVTAGVTEETFTLDGKTYTFKKGILTGVE